MISQNHIISTRLPQNDAAYFEDCIAEYNKVYREMWYIMTSQDYGRRYKKDSYLVSDMCSRHGMLKRTINAIRYDIKGRMKQFRERLKTRIDHNVLTLGFGGTRVFASQYRLKENGSYF